MLAANCAGKRVNEIWYPIPDRTADSVSHGSKNVRGTHTAAAAIPNDEDTEIIRNVLVQFYYPISGQARWIDPRPLAHVRGAADDTVGADFDWADEIVALAHRSNICPLDGRLEPGGLCKGKPGGVLRFSTPYCVGKDSAVVYATYTPVLDSTGKVGKVGKPSKLGKRESELQFRLRRSEDGWSIRGKKTVSPAASDGGGAQGDSAKKAKHIPPVAPNGRRIDAGERAELLRAAKV